MSKFFPKLITKKLLEEQDLIIGMEKYYLKKEQNIFGDLNELLKGKLFTFHKLQFFILLRKCL
jgi:hypothetical protein